MKVIEDLFRRVGVGEIGDDAQAPAALGTAAYVDLVHAADEVGPGQTDGAVGLGRWIAERCRGGHRRRGHRRGGRTGSWGLGDLVGGRRRSGDRFAASQGGAATGARG